MNIQPDGCGGWVDVDKVRIPIITTNKTEPMRPATSEELESINNYIHSISRPTGVNAWDYDNGFWSCNRNTCTSNEYNGISCDECEIFKHNQEVREGLKQ